MFIEKSKNERMILNLPKIIEKTHVFIQYIYEEMNVYDNNDKIIPESNFFSVGKNNVKEYKFFDNIEIYASNDNIKSYNTFFLVSYVDIDYYKGDYKYNNPCCFDITNISDAFNDIIIKISNYCLTSFYYYIFILYNKVLNIMI